MCTVSWDTSSTADLLWFNRDEQRSRSVAEPPRQHNLPEGLSVLSPVDPDGGGTWIGVNECGLIVCLLNAYDLGTPPQEPDRSRGLVVLDLLQSPSTGHAISSLHTMHQQEEIAPCRILLWDRIQPPHVEELFHRNLKEKTPEQTMLTTSSFQPDIVHPWRAQAYQELSVSPHWQDPFHALRSADHPAYGVWMEREDAHTVSQTRIHRSQETCSMAYRTSPDDRWSEIAFPLRPL